MDAIEKILASLQVIKILLINHGFAKIHDTIVVITLSDFDPSYLQAEFDANRLAMEDMCKRTEVLCARLDIDKSRYINTNTVGNSKRHIKEVRNTL